MTEATSQDKSNATVDAYRSAMTAGVLIALAGALVSLLGIRNPARSPTQSTSRVTREQ